MYQQLNLQGGARKWPQERMLQMMLEVVARGTGERQPPHGAPATAAQASSPVVEDADQLPPAPGRTSAELLSTAPPPQVAAATTAGSSDESSRARYIAFDFETTGLGKTRDIRVVQIGARALDASLRSVDRFTSLVNPTIRIQTGAVDIHGISDERVRDEETWAEVGRRLNQWIGRVRRLGAPHGADGDDNDNTTDDNNAPLTLLAHNGKRYDARILVFEHDRHGLGLPPNLYHADTIDVFKQIFPGRRSYKLGELHAWVLGRELENAHDAMADVDGMCALLSHVGRGAVGAAVEASSEALESIAQRCGVAVAQAEVVAQVERRQAELFMAAPAADPAEAA